MMVKFSGTMNYRDGKYYLTATALVDGKPPSWEFPSRAFWIDVEIPDSYFWPEETHLVGKFRDHNEELEDA